MEPVEQTQQPQPLYWDRYRARYNLTFLFALGIAAMGLLEPGWPPLMLIFGLGVAAYSWLTTPKQYLIYTNALVVAYGRPRVKVLTFDQISYPEMLVTPLGERLRVRLVSGKRIMILARQPEEFRDRLDEAMREFNGTAQGGEIVEGIVEDVVEEDQDDPPNY
jgi:hypothetical protein